MDNCKKVLICIGILFTLILGILVGYKSFKTLTNIANAKNEYYTTIELD